MRSTVLFRDLTRAAICAALALAVNAGCKTSSAAGGASAADGGMSASMGMDGGGGMTMEMDGGGMMGMDAGGMMGMDGGGMMAADGGAGGIARDVGQGAGTAAGNVASGAESAGRGVADAGAAAYGATSSAASGAATTAADAARDAAGGARAGAAAAMDGGASGETSATSGGGTADAGGGQLTDAQIAAIAVAANKVDIEAGHAARRKTKNAQVKKFANDMIRDHGSANKQAAALVKKLGVTPEESEMSRAITQGGKDNLDNLKPLKGKEFDRAYAEHEVAYHQQVLSALDEKLIPNAQNPELKSLLQSVRAVVAQHLQHASSLVDSLSK